MKEDVKGGKQNHKSAGRKHTGIIFSLSDRGCQVQPEVKFSLLPIFVNKVCLVLFFLNFCMPCISPLHYYIPLSLTTFL